MSEAVAKDNAPSHDQLEPRPTLAEARARIISNIITEGLKSASTLEEQNVFHLPSSDSNPFSYIEGCVLNPPSQYSNSQDFKNALIETVYEENLEGTPNSIMPVLMERCMDFEGLDYFYDPFNRSRMDKKQMQLPKMKKGERQTAEQRMRSSFLVVCRTSNLPDLYPNLGLVETEQLPADQIVCLIFPREIYDQYLASGLIIPTHIPIKIVDEEVEKSVFGMKKNKFMLPDYEGTLAKIATKIGEPIWIHGVRLPTQQDLDDIERINSYARSHERKEIIHL